MDTKKSKFDYGETIKILKDAPKQFYPNEIGFICGMISIDSEEDAIAYNSVGSDWLYTVELINGKSIQIPEKYLMHDNEK